MEEEKESRSGLPASDAACRLRLVRRQFPSHQTSFHFGFVSSFHIIQSEYISFPYTYPYCSRIAASRSVQISSESLRMGGASRHDMISLPILNRFVIISHFSKSYIRVLQKFQTLMKPTSLCDKSGRERKNRNDYQGVKSLSLDLLQNSCMFETKDLYKVASFGFSYVESAIILSPNVSLDFGRVGIVQAQRDLQTQPTANSEESTSQATDGLISTEAARKIYANREYKFLRKREDLSFSISIKRLKSKETKQLYKRLLALFNGLITITRATILILLTLSSSWSWLIRIGSGIWIHQPLIQRAQNLCICLRILSSMLSLCSTISWTS